MTYSDSIHSRELVRTWRQFPTKLYTFTTAVKDKIFQDRESIKQHLWDILGKYTEISEPPHLFAIAAAWGYMDKSGKPVRHLTFSVIDLIRSGASVIRMLIAGFLRTAFTSQKIEI